MPIFARRRLCMMMNELSSYLDSKKCNDLSNRLEHKDTDTALAAEAEISVLWAISRVAHMAPEPVLPNTANRPDAESDDLFASGPAVIEVRALSDDSFSGKEAMDRTANIIAGYADRLRKGAGKHLYFEFDERSYFTTHFHRERCVDPAFELGSKTKEQLEQWITAEDWPNPGRIRVHLGKTDVVISWKKSTVPLSRTHCRMPPVAYDLEDNPIYKALKKKARQVKGAAEDTLRCVVLVDAGCYLLRRLHPMGGVYEISGEAIIRHALAKLSIDAVIVLSPYRQRDFGYASLSELLWNVSLFDRRETIPDGEYDRLRKLAAQLPKPHFEGYQARDRHKQGAFAPDSRDWYLPTQITTRYGENMTIRLSAGLLHEYLAGRIDADVFRQKAFNNEKNYFELELVQGHSIRQVQFESAGVDEDDDYVMFDLDIDWEKISRKTSSSPTEAE